MAIPISSVETARLLLRVPELVDAEGRSRYSNRLELADVDRVHGEPVHVYTIARVPYTHGVS